MPTQGTTVRIEWTIFDQNSVPLTGMTSPADVIFYLHRTTTTGIVAATETVTLSEIGTTGHYTISFTPENTGTYYLQLKEIDPLTNGTAYRFPIDVYSAGAVFVPSLANAFCSESDIERILQQPITASTKPSSTEAAAYAESRSSVLQSLCAGWGFQVTPTTVENGSRLQDLLREANAIGAALDCRQYQAFGSGTARNTESIEGLRGLWLDYVGVPAPGSAMPRKGYLEMEIRMNLVSRSTDHILSGDTQAAPEMAATDVGILIGMGDLY